ncbi:hypothetical protein [Streptomyces sp. NPDC049916]|uniref:hypothetical protein n=1 Tax=Streptomyces sp. NPDC049916 TaxID=3155156 RepID=UPI0034192940
MAKCEKCRTRKRRWPRTCSACRGWSLERGETAADAAELAVETGLFAWAARGVVAAERLVLRAIG